RLRKAGIQATVFEASQRTGGRCFTLRGAFEANQRVERGAELIDSDHTEI
ncbi:MAG TPA: monoamine oxidase, partial [Solibacterales bacterium]|nr:monoamine oxidase [Bryobacterales bacterium]